jgi:hypothetical protein
MAPLCSDLHTRKGRCMGITFVDSTPLTVCPNQRIGRHKVFEGYARPMLHGGYVGFKLHLVGGLIAYTFQPKKPSMGLWCGESGLTVAV